MTRSTDRRLALILLAMMSGMFGTAYWQATADKRSAGSPPCMPARAQAPDFRFDLPSAYQRFAIPSATRFDEPLGSADGALTYNPQPFWAMNEIRGGHHTGDDLNGIGGMNTDLGDPVFSVADGLVTFAGKSSSGWGNIVIISHRAPGNRIMESMYAHLLDIGVRPGDLVGRGMRIGSVGTANGLYPAHLHFEMREGDGSDIGRGYASRTLTHLDPLGTIASLHNAGSDALDPAPLAVALTAKPQRK